MCFKVFKNTVLLLVLACISCGSKTSNDLSENKEMLQQAQYNSIDTINKSIIVGANRTEHYLPLLQGKRVGVVANQTSVIFKKNIEKRENREEKKTTTTYTHLIDSLLDLNINIKKVFAPEHGFRGTADASAFVKDGKDSKTGLNIYSLHGKHKKPTKAHLKDLDIMVFDIQDVGVRFYTYISTLHYVMEACAEQNIPLLILDRPNPNGNYIDGPVLEKKHSSFLGMHPIPLVHGMTIGEYAKMINGQGWLANGATCNITIVDVKNYNDLVAYKKMRSKYLIYK